MLSQWCRAVTLIQAYQSFSMLGLMLGSSCQTLSSSVWQSLRWLSYLSYSRCFSPSAYESTDEVTVLAAFLCLLCSVFAALHNRNEQFFQVDLLDRALISLGLAVSPPSTSVSSDFMVLCKCFFLDKIILTSLYLV